jgi:uncharacterized protein (DUF1697 family)
VKLAQRIAGGFEQTFGFASDVILRTTAELENVVAKNPFAARRDVEPGKLLVTFLAGHPAPGAQEKVLAIQTDPEELHIDGRELYIYFPHGMGRTKLPLAAIGKILKTPGTARNWNSVLQLLEMAKDMETSGSITTAGSRRAARKGRPPQ